MTKYYSNQPDFTGDPSSPLISPNSYFKTMSDLMDDIEVAGKTVQDEGVEDLYIQKGELLQGRRKTAVFSINL